MFTRRYTALIVMLVIAAIALTGLSLSHPPKTAVYSANRSYDPIETLRIERTDNFTLVDQSYSLIEQVRLDRSASFISVDRSYDHIEQLRGNRQRNTPSADHSYDAIENLRALRIL
jgi:hypothetical protein